MILDKKMIGAWRRESIQINDGQPFEDSQCIWLQSQSRYTDMRRPLSGSDIKQEAFAGKQDWQAPLLTFHHEIDYSGNYPQDQGDISWDGETMVEVGSVVWQGEQIQYTERWKKMPSESDTRQVWEQRDAGELQAIMVRVGDHLIVASKQDQFGAAYFKLSASNSSADTQSDSQPSWQKQWHLGKDAKYPSFVEVMDLQTTWTQLEA